MEAEEYFYKVFESQGNAKIIKGEWEKLDTPAVPIYLASTMLGLSPIDLEDHYEWDYKITFTLGPVNNLYEFDIWMEQGNKLYGEW